MNLETDNRFPRHLCDFRFPISDCRFIDDLARRLLALARKSAIGNRKSEMPRVATNPDRRRRGVLLLQILSSAPEARRVASTDRSTGSSTFAVRKCNRSF